MFMELNEPMGHNLGSHLVYKTVSTMTDNSVKWSEPMCTQLLTYVFGKHDHKLELLD